MKKIILGSLVTLSMIALTVATTANESEAKAPSTKCGGDKTTIPNEKEIIKDKNKTTSKTSSGKCGVGKCGGK